VPLVTEAKNWAEGVYMASTLGSETTAAIVGQVGVVRRDPFAMLAFCGYNITDYFKHWLSFGPRLAKPPKIYLVNWFRKGADGKFIWPGYGENMRVLKWIVERVEGKAAAQATKLGNVPRFGDLDWKGLEGFGEQKFADATSIKPEQWSQEMKLHAEMVEEKLAQDRVPPDLMARYRQLKAEYPF
jgi:phosphoenolpyruvate carboxykinase (GTP)